MALKQFIEQLSTDLAFEQPPEPKENGSYSLLFEPQIDILLSEGEEGVIQMKSVLGNLPKERTEDYLLRMMTANLFGRETGEAALGLDAEGKKVVLVHFLLEQETYRTFYERLEEFVNYTEAWRQETVEFELINE